jgi:hypothetical protein
MENMYAFICCCAVNDNKWEIQKSTDLYVAVADSFDNLLDTLLIDSYVTTEFFNYSTIFNRTATGSANTANSNSGLQWPLLFIDFIRKKKNIKPTQWWKNNHKRIMDTKDEVFICKCYFGESIHKVFLQTRLNINNIVNPKYVYRTFISVMT